MFKLSQEGINFVQKEMQRYESKYSAIIPSLFRVQQENKGWVSSECVDYLSQLMQIPQAHIEEVLDFYTMFNKEPVGKYHIQVCTNITCAMEGGRELVSKLCNKFSVKLGEMSADGKVTISRAECLGSCDTAPVMQINRDPYIENIDAAKLDKVLETLK